MLDSLIVTCDSLYNLPDSILIDPIFQSKQQSFMTNSDFYSSFSNSPLSLKLLLPIFLMILGWVLKLFFDKFIAIKPRLYLKLGNPLYSQRILGWDIGHELTWRFECTLKNNSKYDAYDIELLEYKQNIKENIIITNRKDLNRIFVPNNHIASKEFLDFEIKKTIKTPPETLIKFEKRENDTVIIPGIKISNPQTTLMPNELNKIRLVIKYKNERGKVVYTKFKRINNIETNDIKSIKPWLFHGLVK